MPQNESGSGQANADALPERTTVYYFAYGSNMYVNQMKCRAPGSECVGRAWLHEHSLQFSCVADVEQDNRQRVPGVLWKIEDRSDWECLDRCEGYLLTPRIYDRKVEKVELCGNGNYIDAWVYYINPAGKRDPGKRVAPVEGYARKLMYGYKQAGWVSNDDPFLRLAKQHWPLYTEAVVDNLIENSI